MWDNGGTSRTDDLDWDELSPEEQDAALFLGYTPESWDGEDWESYDWAELPMEIRLAFSHEYRSADAITPTTTATARSCQTVTNVTSNMTHVA